MEVQIEWILVVRKLNDLDSHDSDEVYVDLLGTDAMWT
jgi:hypothetical protein